MAKLDLSKFQDDQKNKLVNNRWESSAELWDTVARVYKSNTAIYSNKADWMQYLPQRRRAYIVQANRIFVNMESVINSLIANPPGINVLPARDGESAQDFARKLESYLKKKYTDLNTKEIMRMGLRNLYFGRLIVIKAFWNSTINDFDYRAIDPNKLRVGKYARKEQDSEFAIEEIEDNLCSVIERFPEKKDELMKKYGIETEADLYIKNPDVKYKEAWIGDYVIFKLDNIVLDTIKNPYWDWEGILISEQEEQQLGSGEGSLEGQARRDLLQQIKLQQDQRKASMAQPVANTDVTDPNAPVDTPDSEYKPYYFNYFNSPRKPYIIATIFNNENTPIGRTDMITLSADLQKGIDKRKMDIDENCELVNGIIKVDASCMSKSDAQRIRFETKGIIWGKGVATGVQREMGTALPEMVFKDMLDSRSEIDNIMAASSAFRGEREGQETKAGRLALIQQSFLRLNELVQVTDYVYQEMFCWGMQLAKTRYTEYHSVEMTDKEGEREAIELIQDDIEVGNKVTIIAGKSLPVDDEFRFEQAQNDVKNGFLSPADYLKIAQYNDPRELAKNNVTYKLNPAMAVGITPEEMQQIQPPQQAEEKPPSVSISYADLPPDAQAQLLEKIGIQADPNILAQEKMLTHKKAQDEFDLKKQAQDHGQMQAEKSMSLEEKQANTPQPKK